MSFVGIQYVFRGKGKGKFHPRTGHEDPEGAQRYSSTHFLTSVLDGVGGQCHAPATLLPGRRPITHGTGQSGQVRKILPPQGFDSQTVQPV